MSGTQQWKVYGGALLFSLIVGFSFLGVKTGVGIASPWLVLAYRFNFAALAAILVAAFGIARLELGHKPKKDLVLTAGFYLGFMALQVVGLLFATSIESGIIFAIIPILTKLMARVFLGETGTWKQNAFVGLSVTAVILLFLLSATGIERIHPVGLLLLFLSSLSMAISNVFMRHVRSRYSPFAIAFAICIGGCLFFNAAAFAFGLGENGLAAYTAPLASGAFLLATAFLGIPSTLVSSLLMAYMLAHMQAVKATIFGNLSTAISILVGIVVLAEPFSFYHLLCTALIIAGVVGTSVSGARPVGK